MKRFVSFVLIIALILGIFSCVAESGSENDLPALFDESDEFAFTGIDDPELLQYVQDSVYATLDSEFVNSDIIIEDVSAIYISREYLEEVAYNTKTNLFFGYSLDQVNEIFQGQKYVFTCYEGQTVVTEFEELPDTAMKEILKNVAIGVGVILVCVVVTVVSHGAAGPAAASVASRITSIIAFSPKIAAIKAVRCSLFCGALRGLTRGIETNWNTSEMLTAAALSASEGFKWGAITGALETPQVEMSSAKTPIKRVIRHLDDTLDAVSDFDSNLELLGYSGLSFYGGEQVPFEHASAVRPDFVSENVAYEVKDYDLKSKESLYALRSTLKSEISARTEHLPTGMEQAIILNVEGRGYTYEYVCSVADWIQDFMQPIYPDIPVYITGATI